MFLLSQRHLIDDDFYKCVGPVHLMTGSDSAASKIQMSRRVTWIKNAETRELSASLWNTDFIDKACQLHTFMSFLYSLPLNEIYSSCP